MKQGFSSKPRYTFGILTTVAKDIFRSRYHAGLLSGIFRRLGTLGHELKVFTLPARPYRSLDGILLEHDLDALMILTWRWIHPEIARLIETTRHDRVLVFNDPLPGLRVHQVYTDIAAGMAQAVGYLAKKKYRTIGMLHGPKDVTFKEDGKIRKLPFIDTCLKENAFATALKTKKIPVKRTWIRAGEANSEAEGYRLMKRWLREKKLPRAIVCGNDDLAFGAIKAIQGAGLDCPADIAVTGFDDNEQAKSFTVPLTTVRQPLARMGADAVDILLAGLAGSSACPVRKSYPPELIVRKSA